MTDEEVRTIQDNLDEYDCGELYDKVVVLLAEVARLSKALAEAEARIERMIAQTGGGTQEYRTTLAQFSRLRGERFLIDKYLIDADEQAVTP